MAEKTGRYSVPNDEDFEPGSDGQVLKNNFSIISKDEIEEIEGQELSRVENELIKIFDQDHSFSVKDICDIHKQWLGEIYPSAGKYRSVNMSKGDFSFAAPSQIEKLMQDLEKNYTPCHIEDNDQLANALRIVHIELIIIHPFREGNGRTARLLADLMTMQSGHASLNYAPIDRTTNKKGFEKYILAIHAGFSGDYEPIKNIFRNLIIPKK